jgi:hypothetical protein
MKTNYFRQFLADFSRFWTIFVNFSICECSTSLEADFDEEYEKNVFFVFTNFLGDFSRFLVILADFWRF